MKHQSIMVAIVGFVSVSCLAQETPFEHQRRPQKAYVSILAREYISAHTYAGGQDVYVASARLHGKPAEYVVLKDRYREMERPLDSFHLKERRTFQMRLVREPVCDQSSAYIDGLKQRAEVFDREGLDSLSAKGAPENLPCYTVLHDSIKMGRR